MMILVGQSECARLNVPRVLLPFSENPPQFRITADSGCYTWTSTRPDIIRIEQDQPESGAGCSTAIKISAVVRIGSKVSAGVLAEDQVTGLTLRADVIVDRINSLKIVTKTHELYKEETPEKFEVRAYDEQGNEFSTVEGLIFKWMIEPTRAGTEILRFIPWAESPYNTEPYLEKIEMEGKQGNKILLEGTRTGSAKVTVRLIDANNNVPPTSESLMVVANLFLIPQLAYILPGAKLKYKATQFRGNRALEVALPSPHHQLGVDEILATLDQSTATLTGKQIGSGQVELVDQNVDEAEVVKTPKAELHVVQAASIKLTCLPFLSWSVLVHQPYQIKVELFDKDSNKIYLSDNLVIDFMFDKTYLTLTHSLQNGTLHDIIPQISGRTEVTAKLRGLMVDGSLVEPPEVVLATATLEIFNEMTLSPALVVLPWNPSSGSTVSSRFTVTGGSSPYIWASTNTSLGTMSQMGIATVNTNKVGGTTVTAAMTRASHNRAQADILVEPAEKLMFLKSEREFLVNTELVLPLAIQTQGTNIASRCDGLPFQTVMTDKTSFSHSYAKSAADGACAGLVIAGNKVGHTKIQSSFTYLSGLGQNKKLSDTAIVATYSQLKPVFPSSGETLVAVGSSIQIVWTGGPEPWPEQPSNHFRSLVTQKDNDVVKVETTRELGGVYAYKVQCLTLGETQIQLSVGNKASKSLPSPVVLTSTVKVTCGQPASIVVSPRIQGPTGLAAPCPTNAKAGRVATQSYLDLELDVILKDAQGVVFDSVDSVEVTWTMSDSSLGKLATSSGLLKRQQGDVLEQPGKPYQILKVNKKIGKLDIKASLPKPGILSSSPEATVMLLLVEDARVEPASIQVFHHNIVQQVAKVVQGSSFFLIETLDSGSTKSTIVEASYHQTNQSINVKPLQPGTAKVVVRDLCLSAVEPGMSVVTVKGVVKVELEIQDKVQRGKQISGQVRLYAANNQLLDASILEYVTLSVTSQSDIVSLTEASSLLPAARGDELGTTNLVATASYQGIKVSSSPAPVQVFSPLRIEPRNITIIIGASFQVETIGGPAESSIEYSLGDETIGEVQSDGLVTGVTLGSTTLTARSIGYSKTGEVVEYSRDTVYVHVVALSAVRLYSPTKKIVTGGEVPIYILGQDDNINSYSFASALPSLQITWSLQGSAGQLESSWKDTGLSLSKINSGVAVLHGLSAGKLTVNVKVQITEKLGVSGQYQMVENRALAASTEIIVVDDLRSRLPGTGCSNYVLMAPGSSLDLQTNRKSQAVFTKITDSSVGVSVSRLGVVKVESSSQPSTSHVVASLEEDVGLNLLTSWVVEVRPVHFIVLEGGSSVWKVKSGATELPRGGVVAASVNCYDALGRKFKACSLDLEKRPSRFDLTTMNPKTKGTFDLNLVSDGFTVHRIKDKISGQTAWAVTEVKDSINVPRTVGVGDVVNLLANVEPVGQGVWSSGASSAVSVDSSGLLVATRAGQATLDLSTSQGNTLQVDLTVTKSSRIIVSSDTILTCKDQPQIVPVVFQDGIFVTGSKTDFIQPTDLFTCSVSSDKIDVQFFKVRAVLTSSSWGCEFSCQSSPADVPATVNVQVESGDLIGLSSLEYVPPFTVSSPVIEIGPSGAYLRVSGHRDVLTGLSTRGEGVHLDSWWLEDDQLVLPVSLISPIKHDSWVQISYQGTDNTVKVQVIPVMEPNYTQKSSLFGIDLSMLITLMSSVIIAAYLISNAKPSSPPPPAASSSSPPKSSAPATQSSPTPYLWSVDNTPIYGSPLVKRSPVSNARNLSQYSYS